MSIERLKIPATVVAAGAGLVVGLGIHYLAVFLRDSGPSFGSWSLQGNGALIVLPAILLVLVVGEILLAAREAWLGLIAWPVGLYAGVFVVAGTF